MLPCHHRLVVVSNACNHTRQRLMIVFNTQPCVCKGAMNRYGQNGLPGSLLQGHQRMDPQSFPNRRVAMRNVVEPARKQLISGSAGWAEHLELPAASPFHSSSSERTTTQRYHWDGRHEFGKIFSHLWCGNIPFS